MIGDLLLVLVIGVLAGAIGAVFGIVVLAPRLRRGLDRADADEERVTEAAAGEPDDRAD